MRIWLSLLAGLSLLAVLFVPVFSGETTGYAAPTTSVASGHAKFYSPGIFQAVARNRGMKLRSDVEGYAAVPNCRLVGQIVKARINGHVMERYQVIDCSAPGDRSRHIREGLVIEVDYQSAVRNLFANQGRAPADVYYP